MKEQKDIFNEENKIKHPFTTPNGYFDDLEQSILGKVEKQKSKRLVFPALLKLSMAASFLIFAGLYLVFKTNTNTEIKLSSVSDEEIYYYIDEVEFDSDYVVSMASLDDLSQMDEEIEEEFVNSDTELLDDIDIYEEI